MVDLVVVLVERRDGFRDYGGAAEGFMVSLEGSGLIDHVQRCGKGPLG